MIQRAIGSGGKARVTHARRFAPPARSPPREPDWASRSLEADVPPVVELEVDDVVLEKDHAFRPREAPCAAHDRVFAATVDLLRERDVNVLPREGIGRLECSARRAVQAADEDLGSLLLIRAARVELRFGDVCVPATVQTPGQINRRVIP